MVLSGQFEVDGSRY